MKNIDVKILWDERYSLTMDNDDIGRWARVAYAGKLKGSGFYKGNVVQYEIAWITKLNDPKTNEFLNKFVVHPNFPYPCAEYVFDTLEEAKKVLHTEFKRFVKNCITYKNKEK